MNLKWIPCIALAVLIAGCNQSGTTTVAQSSPPSPTTAVVKKQDLVGYSFFDGKLVIPTTAQASAFSPYDTPVEAVSTSLGKYVERGEPIVKLTIPGADSAAIQAKANASTANAQYSDAKNLASEPVKRAQKALDDAKAAEKVANDTVAAGGAADTVTATQNRQDAEAALLDAQQKMKQTLQPAKDVVTTSAVQLETVKADAAQGIVRAPISGTVVSLDAKPGMDAHAKQSLATVIDFGAVRIQGTVPPELKDAVGRGTHVTISMDGQNSEPMEGRVLKVKVLPPDFGNTSSGYLAEIEFLKPRSMLQLSTVVKRIGVSTGSAKQVLVVPVAAILTQHGKSVVNVQKGSDWTPTPVVTGLTDGALIEIKSGLTEGAVVQLSPPKSGS